MFSHLTHYDVMGKYAEQNKKLVYFTHPFLTEPSNMYRRSAPYIQTTNKQTSCNSNEKHSA